MTTTPVHPFAAAGRKLTAAKATGNPVGHLAALTEVLNLVTEYLPADLASVLLTGEEPAPSSGYYVLVFDHKYGTDTTLHASRAAAEATRADIIESWWMAEFDEEPCPEVITEEDVERYCEKAGESFAITAVGVPRRVA